MTALGPAAFQARLEALVNSQKQRQQLLEAETEIYIAKRKEYRERQSRGQQLQKIGSKFYVKAEEITWEMKAIEDQRDAATLALNDLESKQRSLSEELFELQKKGDDNRKFYECEGTEIRNFKLQVRNHASTIQAEITDEWGQSWSISNGSRMLDVRMINHRIHLWQSKCDFQTVRAVAAASDRDVEDATDVTESERIRVMSAKKAIGRNVCSNINAVNVLEQRLHEALLRSGARRDLAAAVETLNAEITVLQATERKLEDEVLQSITRRDRRKRELNGLECKLAQKKKLFYG